MVITNEFNIERYIGKDPLPLLSAPSNISSELLAKYNTFISNISTIYGTQNSNGSIPVFYKSANNTPNPNSTLTSLQSGEEYYFISRSSSTFPYDIPAIGGAISNPTVTPTCDSRSPCCPSVFFNNSTVSLSGPPENTYAYISASVTGLIPGKVYTYNYSSVAANWPAKITPISGTLLPSSGVESIDSIFTFCPSTTDCPGCFPYVLDCYPDKDIVKKNIYSILELKVSGPNSSSCDVVADRITIRCNKCLPEPCEVKRPYLSFTGSPKLTLAPNCCANPVPISLNVTGAEPGKRYDFVFSAWPTTVQVIPSSGISGFGDGGGKLSAMVNLNGEQSAVVKCALTDTITSETFVDFISIQCNTSC
jgi:hypothetical protein